MEGLYADITLHLIVYIYVNCLHMTEGNFDTCGTAVHDIWIEMFCRCQPAYVKYSIIGLPEHRSEGLEHEENLYFNDVNVTFTGSFDLLILWNWGFVVVQNCAHIRMTALI